jgi:ribosome-binding factor A
MSLRTDRVASLVKEEAGMFIARELNSPAFGLITVMEVKMTPDLKIAKIYVSVLGKQEAKDAALEMLEERKGELRSFLGSVLRMKFTPSIQIYLDETMERVDKINRLIQQIHKDDAPKSDQP